MSGLNHLQLNFIVKKSLSKEKLLENSGNNKIGLDAFIEKVSNPDTIDKIDSRPIASFKTSDMATDRFLLSNESYLSEFGFKIVKDNKELITSWSSDIIYILHQERNNSVNLDLSGVQERNNGVNLDLSDSDDSQLQM